MAVGNAIVTTARFKPLSYQEWAAPLQALNAQHAATEEALLDIQDNLADIEHYVTTNPNSAIAQRYKDYINNIDQQAQILSNSGINPQTRADLLNLRREYTNIVKPIKNGIALYQKAAAKRAKDYNKGIIGNDITPDVYIHNPDYIDNYTTIEDIVKDATNTFKSLKGYSANIQEEDLGNGITALGIPQSYSREDYINAFEGNEDAPEELVQTINTLKSKYTKFAGNDENMQALVDYAIRQGAGSSIVNPKISFRKTGTSAGTSVSTGLGNIPTFKGYTPIKTDSGEVLQMHNSQYYRMIPQEGGGYIPEPVTGDVTIGGKKYTQKKESAPGTLVTEPTVPNDNEYTRGFTINYRSQGKDAWTLGSFNSDLLKHHANNKAKIMTYSEAIGSKGLPDKKAKNALTEYVRNQFGILDKKAEDNIVVEMIPIDKQHYKIHVLEKNSKYVPQQEESNSTTKNPVTQSITFGNQQ